MLEDLDIHADLKLCFFRKKKPLHSERLLVYSAGVRGEFFLLRKRTANIMTARQYEIICDVASAKRSGLLANSID